MQIKLPPELEPFVEQEFATGRYATREEVVVQALCWLRDERQAKQSPESSRAWRMSPLAERRRWARHWPISGRNSASGKRNDTSRYHHAKGEGRLAALLCRRS